MSPQIPNAGLSSARLTDRLSLNDPIVVCYYVELTPARLANALIRGSNDDGYVVNNPRRDSVEIRFV